MLDTYIRFHIVTGINGVIKCIINVGSYKGTKKCMMLRAWMEWECSEGGGGQEQGLARVEAFGREEAVERRKQVHVSRLVFY